MRHTVINVWQKDLVYSTWEDNQIRSLCQSIVIQAIKDYRYPQYKRSIMNWVVEMEGTFPIVSESMNLSAYILRDMMIDKMIAIDTHGTATLFISSKEHRRYRGERILRK